MLPLLTLAALYIAPRAVRATPCVAMDINWNLYAFGLDGKDWSAGTQDSWGSGMFSSCLNWIGYVSEWRALAGTATDVTASGRPCVALSPVGCRFLRIKSSLLFVFMLCTLVTYVYIILFMILNSKYLPHVA